MTSPDPHAVTGAPAPDEVALDQPFAGLGDLYTLRSAVAAHASAQGAPRELVEFVVVIANELATNAIVYGGGSGRLRLWRDGDLLYCQVSDGGPGIAEPAAAGTVEQSPATPGGRGLWITRQLSDRLDIATGPDGTTITVTTDLAGRPDPSATGTS
jgi:anti-sigma regulatory factor (Ser/Thr protein kinase)